MMNQVIMVGRIAKMESNVKGIVTIAINRTYKNADGEYETDFIPITLFGSTSNTTFEYCKQGDIIGIRGRLQIENNKVVVVADKVTFLSTKREKVNE